MTTEEEKWRWFEAKGGRLGEDRLGDFLWRAVDELIVGFEGSRWVAEG